MAICTKNITLLFLKRNFVLNKFVNTGHNNITMQGYIFRNIIFKLKKQLMFNIVGYHNVFTKHFCSVSAIYDIDRSLLNKHIKHLEQEYNVMKGKGKAGEKRLQILVPIMEVITERNKLFEQLKGLSEITNDDDEEMNKLIEEETKLYQIKISKIEEELLEAFLPSNNIDSCNSIVLEISAGVGGQEAMLFAKELFDMYWNFAIYKGWECQLAEFNTTDLGGIRHASIFIDGPQVYQCFQFEAGVHRVQRIPTTERSGRVHTSTVSVVALPQPRDVDIQLQDKDLRIETKRASGAGGQHVNTTDSAVRIVHLPTNTMVECQVDRSQIKNRQIAMQKLKALLYEKQLNEQLAMSEATRKSQVHSNFRNEKIRTYNYSQDRITDHRLQGSNIHNLKVFLEGGEPLDNLINKLHISARQKQLLDLLTSTVETK